MLDPAFSKFFPFLFILFDQNYTEPKASSNLETEKEATLCVSFIRNVNEQYDGS